MPYKVTDLHPGDILVMQSRPHEKPWDALLDAAIRWSTSSPWVHTCLVGHGILINPLWHVRTDALDTYAANGWVFTPDASPQQKERAVAWAMHRVGQLYSIKELLLDAARFDLHWMPKLKHRLSAYTCSGFVTMAYRQAGVIVTYAPWPAPSDLIYSPALRGARP